MEERESLADVINIHDHLTNQIFYFPDLESIPLEGKAYATCYVLSAVHAVSAVAAMYKVWLECVQVEPSLLSSPRKHGLTRLGYTSLISAIDAIFEGKGHLRQRTDWIQQVTESKVV